MSIKTPIYLDNHATTPTDPAVVAAMLPYFTQNFGNPQSTTHIFGWKAEAAVNMAREQVAQLIGSTPQEIIFTSGATESNNLALLGAAQAANSPGHIISSATEHSAVLNTLHELQRRNFRVTLLGTDQYGQIPIDAIRNAIEKDTILFSFMAANNEVGTFHRINEIGKLAKERSIIFHCDAAQGVGKMNLHVENDSIDLLSLSGHKIYGPKGVGALYVRRKNPRVELKPITFGGGQERNLRSGTLNVPGIVGLGTACALMQSKGKDDAQRVRQLRDSLENHLLENIPELIVNGHPKERLYNNLNISVPHVEGESLLVALKEIAFSGGSACQSQKDHQSHVLQALGKESDIVRSSMRFGLGRFTTKEEIDRAKTLLCTVIPDLQKNSALYQVRKKNTITKIGVYL